MFLNIKLGQGHGKMEEEMPARFKEASLRVECFDIWNATQDKAFI